MHIEARILTPVHHLDVFGDVPLPLGALTAQRALVGAERAAAALRFHLRVVYLHLLLFLTCNSMAAGKY